MIPVELARDEVVDGRRFAAPETTGEDAAVMREMLGRMRTLARSWRESPPPGESVLVKETDATGARTWIRVPERSALLAAEQLTTIGFFGQARADVDHDPIHRLEEAIVDTLEEVPGLLSYFNLGLAHGGYGNLILCNAADVPLRWREHRIHRRAVELAPRHYHSARLHSGIVRSPLSGDAGLEVTRTRYYDFDSEPVWLAVRG